MPLPAMFVYPLPEHIASGAQIDETLAKLEPSSFLPLVFFIHFLWMLHPLSTLLERLCHSTSSQAANAALITLVLLKQFTVFGPSHNIVIIQKWKIITGRRNRMYWNYRKQRSRRYKILEYVWHTPVLIMVWDENAQNGMKDLSTVLNSLQQQCLVQVWTRTLD